MLVNMKVMKKIVCLLIIGLVLCGIYSGYEVQASTPSEIVKSITPEDQDKSDFAGINQVIGKLLGFLQVASGLTAVIIIAFTGFEYITSTPDVKGEIKRKMLPIVIGIVLVFGAVSISNFLISVAG